MGKLISRVGALVLCAGLGAALVPGCVIRVGPGTGDETEPATTGGGSGGQMDPPPKTDEELAAETFAQLDPQELAFASARVRRSSLPMALAVSLRSRTLSMALCAEPYEMIMDKELRDLVSTTVGVMSLTAALAAPRYLAKADVSKRPTRQQLLGLYDDFIALGNQPGRTNTAEEERLIVAARRLRAELESWDFSLQAPEPVIAAARELMEAFDIGKPAEGWDQWEGPEE